MKNLDIKLTILFNLLCIVFVLFPPLNNSPLRIVLGTPIILILPGYSLIGALFPRRNDLSWITRASLSLGISIIIAPLLGLALNYTPFGIRLIPVLAVLSTFIISLSIVAWFRRMNLPVEERLRVPFERLLNVNLGQSVLDKVLSIVLITSIIGASATLTYVVVMPKSGERFTEFYLLNTNGMASNYPTDLKVGDEKELIIGIVNQEYENDTYRLEVEFNGFLIHEEKISLIENEIWENSFTFKVSEKGEKQKLEFLLYKGQHREVYRTLHLWITVT